MTTIVSTNIFDLPGPWIGGMFELESGRSHRRGMPKGMIDEVMMNAPGAHGGGANDAMDFALCRDRSEKVHWTNFHFVMCIGITGFFVFWIVLLCRMYLPPEYRFWAIAKP